MGLHASTVGGLDFIPSQGIRSNKLHSKAKAEKKKKIEIKMEDHGSKRDNDETLMLEKSS